MIETYQKVIGIWGYFKDGSHGFENGLGMVWCVKEREGVKGDPKLA